MKQRLIWADSLKGWLMIFVIIGHAIQCVLGDVCNDNHVWNLIYSFHMPAFMAVSGWLFYRPTSSADLRNKIGRRFCQLMIPYFIWSFISYITHGEYTAVRFCKIILRPDAFFWFLWVLFFIYIIFVTVQNLSKRLKINEDILLFIVVAILIAIMVVSDIRVFGFQQIAYYFLFYSLGYFFHKHPKIMVSNHWLLSCLFMLWLSLAWFWQQHGVPSWLPSIPLIPQSLMQYLYRGFTTTVAIYVILCASPFLLNGSGSYNKLISYLGSISMGLYVVHLSFGGINFIIKIITNFCPDINLIVLVIWSTSLSLIISTLIVYLLMKNHWTAKVLFGKL